MSSPNNPDSKQQLKKYAVIAVMFGAFAVSMWLIFAPSEKDKQEQEKKMGLNTNLPDPKKEVIVGDKKAAYEQEQAEQKHREKMRTVQDYSFELGDRQPAGQVQPAADVLTPEEQERQIRMAPKPAEFSGSGYQHTDAYKRGNTVQATQAAYADINRTLGNFYEEPKTDPEKEELKAQVEQLRASMEANKPAGGTLEEQVALMEKSYELAAKYSGAGQKVEATQTKKVVATPVQQVRKQIVSALNQPMSNAEFVKGFSQPRNMGFNTVGEAEGKSEANTIGAVVQGEQVVTDGQAVRLRLTEPLQAGATQVSANSIVTGMAKISGERLEITISSIEFSGKIIPVDLTAYDTDGQQGIFIPGSMEVSAVKQIAANAGGNLGSSINISQQSAGQQLATDLGRGVIQGTSAYLSKKISQVKVTLKSGYRLMLLPGDN